MPCYHPLDAWQKESGEIVFAERGQIRRVLSLPCGQCIGCRLERSRQWAVRCMHEAQMHDRNSFVTLTYEPKYLPPRGSLRYSDFQLFIRAVRRRVDGVKFLMCGEYGEQFERPHFHACMFGIGFDDRVLYSKSNGIPLYCSAMLQDCWPNGLATVGELTFQSAQYVAGYVTKKVTGKKAADHYARVDTDTGEVWHLTPEFARMSLRPAIGAGWFDKYKPEVFPSDRIVVNGKEASPPRYYKKLLSASFPEESEFVDYQRYKKAQRVKFDNTSARLRARETVTRARIKHVENLKG